MAKTKINTHNISCWHLSRFSMLFFDDLLEFLFVPIFHSFIFIISHVHIKRPLLGFTFNGKIVRELTLITFPALTLFEERTNYRLGISSFLDFLSLHRFEEHCQFLLFFQFLFLLQLFCVIFFDRMMTASFNLLLDLLYEFLLLGAFFVFQSESFILNKVNCVQNEENDVF